jgi:putative phosphoesterase
MRIGIISDTHGDAATLEKVMSTIFHEIDIILHAGDVLYHGPRNLIPKGYNPSRLAEILNSLKSPVLIAKGNCDAEVDQLLLKIPLANPFLFTVLNGKRVLVHHGHSMEGEGLEELVNRWEIDLCISGHTHIATLSKVSKCLYFNPGSCALPKDGGVQTVGLWDTDTISLINVNSGSVLDSMKI